MKLYKSKPLKPLRTSTTNLWNQRIFKKHSAKSFFQSLKVLLESSFKASKNFKVFDPLKLHRIQALKSWRIFTTNFWRSRIFKEPMKNKKSTKRKKSQTRTWLEIYRYFIPKTFQSIFQSKWRTFCVRIQTSSTQYLNCRLFQRDRIRGLFCYIII